MTCNKNRQDPDISIRKRALDVTYSLVDEANIKSMTKVGSFQKSDEKCWSIKGTWLRFLSLMFVRLLTLVFFFEPGVWCSWYTFVFSGLWRSRYVKVLSGKMHPLPASYPSSFDPQELLNYLLVAEPDFKDGENRCHFVPLDIRWCTKKMFLQTLAVYFKDLEQQKHTNTIPIHV